MKRRVRGMARAPRIASHPLSGTCGLCDKPLGTVELLKRRDSWVHKSCWLLEKGE